jgi:hypothetical protein
MFSSEFFYLFKYLWSLFVVSLRLLALVLVVMRPAFVYDANLKHFSLYHFVKLYCLLYSAEIFKLSLTVFCELLILFIYLAAISSKLPIITKKISFNFCMTHVDFLSPLVSVTKRRSSQCLRWGGMKRDGIPFLFDKPRNHPSAF